MISGSCWCWWYWPFMTVTPFGWDEWLSLFKCDDDWPLTADPLHLPVLFKRTARWCWPPSKLGWPPLLLLITAFPVLLFPPPPHAGLCGSAPGNACGSGRSGWLGPLSVVVCCCDSPLWLLIIWRCRLIRLRRWTTTATVITIRRRVTAAPTNTPNSGVIWK